MDNNETRLMNLPTASIMDRIHDMEMRTLRRAPQNIGEAYVASVAKGEDRFILEQAARTLPRSLTELISLLLRDEGNALIEETRLINNRYVGSTIKTLQAQVVGDLEVIELRDRVLDWSERVVNAVLFKMRRQVTAAPVKTYAKLYLSFVHELDTTIAHGSNDLYSLIWDAATEALPYGMLDGIFIQTELISGFYKESAANGESEFFLRQKLRCSNAEWHFVAEQLTLYSYSPTVYAQEVVLRPLLKTLKDELGHVSKSEQRRLCGVYLADLLEAFPYLLSSTRIGKSIFPVEGSRAVAAFDYICRDGFGCFFLSDSASIFEREIAFGKSLGILEVLFDGKIAFYPYPRMTLEAVFGEDDGLLLTYWLLKQARERVLTSYLKINSAYLARGAGAAKEINSEGKNTPDNVYSEYTSWVREAQEPVSDAEHEETDGLEAQEAAQIPQMRRSRLFKLLSLCGVTIAQGKGSEIKLLRDNSHPFRLGNHYGPNPTVPSFLIANILKRLEISRPEWRQAIASAGYE